MMGAALPQAPAQTGLASILAALGQGAPSGNASNQPGFEQLFASLPGGATTGTTPAASIIPAIPALPTMANPFAIEAPGQPAPPIAASTLAIAPGAEALSAAVPAPPAAALFGLPQPVADAPVDAAPPIETAVKAPTKPETEAQPANDAAAAATLLIAAATPFKAAAPANDKVARAAHDEADAPTGGEIASSADAAPILVAAQPAPAIVETPTTATVVATVLPATEKPVAEKATKPAAPAAAQRQADTATLAAPVAKLADATQPQPTTLTPAEPKAAKPAAGADASMTVLFTQPALQGASALAEAARAAPVAERLLDMGSDDQWISQLAADIAATKSETGDLSFRLMPRHLGRLDVAMTMEADGVVSLKLDTQHEVTATIVQAAQPRLVEDLRQQGVRVADAQVTHTPTETGRQQQQQGQGRQAAPGASHLIETAPERPGADRNERTADRRGRFA